MIPRDFFFSNLYNFWQLLWLIPLLSLTLYAHIQRKKTRDVLIQNTLQSFVIIPKDLFRTIFQLICFSLGWVFAVIALMGPMGNEYYLEEKTKSQEAATPLEIFLVLDVSQSMAVRDGRNKQMRLKMATEIADRLVAKIKNDPVALFLFTSELVPFVPLTYDRTFIRLMLRELGLNEGDHYGTNFQILEQLKKQLYLFPQAPKALVIFSDGEEASIEASSKNERKAALSALVKSLNVPIFTVGIGSKEGGEVPDVGRPVISRLDETTLKKISGESKGAYFSGNTQSAEEVALRIYQSLERLKMNESFENVTSASQGHFHSYFQIPLTLAICLFGLFFLMPTTHKNFFIFLVFIPMFGFASISGEALYESGHYKEASDWFALELKRLPPEWLRNKLLYNLGTSLMAEKKWQEAESAFFAISKEAYESPVFRSRLLYNYILALYSQGEDILPFLEWMDLKEFKEKIQDEGTKGSSDPLDLAILLFRLASLLDKPASPLLPAILKKLSQDAELILIQKALEEKKLDEATFILIQKKLKQISSPKEFLEGALEELAVANGLPNGHIRVAENASRFYALVLEWQKKKFNEGMCQCAPWDEVLPLFTAGLRRLNQEPFEKQIFYVYEKWLEALQLLQQEKEDLQDENKPEEEELRELREMQNLDKPPSQPKMKPVGGMPW